MNIIISSQRINLIVLFLVLGIGVFAQAHVVISPNQSLQGQMRKAETVYVIRGPIDMKGASITVPQGCTLKFEGGTLKNGTLTYNNTFIEGNYKIYCKCKGTIANDVVEPHMFGARGDGKTDDSYAIQQTLSCGKKIIFRRATYVISTPIVLDRREINADFNGATIKKESQKCFNFVYENIDYKKIPSVLIVKPIKSPNTNGFMTVKNLVVDGGKVNIGFHAIWCRNVILENIRIHNAKKGIVYKGFLNTFKDITIWNCQEGIVTHGGNATLFERCFTSNCGWEIDKAHGFSLVSCSSDNFNPCYNISNSTVSMVGCTQESKGEGIVVINSVLELSGDFESHIYDSTKKITYIKASGGSAVYAKGCKFHLDNYLKKRVPDSNIFEIYDSSKIELEGKIVHGTGVKILKSDNARMTVNGRSLSNGLNR